MSQTYFKCVSLHKTLEITEAIQGNSHQNYQINV